MSSQQKCRRSHSELFNMLNSHPFVQGVCGLAGSTPAAILYTPEQLLDLKRFCFSSAVAQNSVLGVDKT